MNTSLLRYIIVLLFLGSCILKEDANLVLPKEEQKVYVEAYLAKGQPITVSLFESNSLDAALSVKLLWNAEPTVTFQDTSIQLLNLFYYDPTSGKIINYANPYLVKHQQDSIFLSITLPNGKKINSMTEVVEPIEIVDYKIEQGTISITCNQGKNNKNPFYGFFLQQFSKTDTIINMSYFNYSSQEALNQVILQQKLGSDMDSIVAIAYRMNALNYDFQTKLKQASAANIDPYQSPVKLPSNINGGAGIFTFYSSDTLRINIKK